MILKLTCKLRPIDGAETEDEDEDALKEKLKAVVEDLLYDLDDWKASEVKIGQE